MSVVYTTQQPLPCICARLRKASRAATRFYDGALAGHGLTVTQFSLLRTARLMNGPSLSELAARTGHERTALWRTLQPLLKAGWLAADGASGGRAQRLTLTDAGERLTEAARPEWDAAQRKLAGMIGGYDAAELIRLLEKVERLDA